MPPMSYNIIIYVLWFIFTQRSAQKRNELSHGKWAQLIVLYLYVSLLMSTQTTKLSRQRKCDAQVYPPNTIIVAYNNSYRILNRLPMRCSASGMFASDNVNYCTCVIRKYIYSLTTRIFKSTNPIVKSIVWGDVYCTSALRNRWISLLYTV